MPSFRAGPMAAVNAAYNAAQLSRAVGLGPAELQTETVRPRGTPGAGSAAAMVGAAAGTRVEKEDGTEKTSTKEIIAALTKMKAQSNPNGLFYTLYPQPESKNSEEDMEKWCRRAASRLEEDDHEDDALPTDSVMSGVFAALAFVQGGSNANLGPITATDLCAGAAHEGVPANSTNEKVPAAEHAVTSDMKDDNEDLKRKLLDILPEKDAVAPGFEQATAANVDNFSTLTVRELKQRICNLGAEVPAGVAEKSELVDFLRSLVHTPEDSNSHISTTATEVEADPNKRGRFL